MNTRTIRLSVLIGVGLGSIAPALASGDRSRHEHVPPGEDLAAWEETYNRWSYGQTPIAADHNGNAVIHNVVLMPLPSTPGDGTPGTIDVRLDRNQSFMLPLWTALGTSYTDGTPPDPFEPVSIFETLDIAFSVDGVPVVDEKNKMDYFSKFTFTPEIPFVSPPLAAIIWFEGIGVLHAPLCRGKHVLELDAINTQPVFGAFAEYHNTWIVTVR